MYRLVRAWEAVMAVKLVRLCRYLGPQVTVRPDTYRRCGKVARGAYSPAI